MMTISITVNEQSYQLEPATTINGLLKMLDMPKDKIAVERNRMIVAKSSYATEELLEGDQIEIVHFVGGG